MASFPLRSLLKGWLISFIGWGAVALAVGGLLAGNVGIPWRAAVEIGVREWLPWALLTPLLFRFTARFPLTRESWKSAVPAHFVCCVVTLMLCELGGLPFGGPPGGRLPPPPPGVLASGGRSPGNVPPPRPEEIPRSLAFLRMIALRLPIYLTVISAAHALVFYRSSQEREMRSLELAASLAKARLEALKMQLQPHFLFNSLNAIAELVHRDPPAAEEMIVALGELLRLTLSTSGEQELSLSRELELVERYLAIEHIRFGDRLRFESAISAESSVAMVPAFLLQPLVENAVRHGLEPQMKSGVLKIAAARQGERLVVTVADNGVGLPEGRVPREGIGLGNTRARLREFYGDGATLELRNGGGLTVEIVLPYRVSA